MRAANWHQRGMSLIELMISITLGMIVIGYTVGFYGSAVGLSAQSLNQNHLNQELRAVLTMVARDLRRAGGWGATSAVTRVAFGSNLELAATSGQSIQARLRPVGSSAMIANTDTILATLGPIVTGLTLRHIGDNGVNYRATVASYSYAAGNPGVATMQLNLVGSWPSSEILAATWSVQNPFSEMIVDGNCILFAYDRIQDGESLPDGILQRVTNIVSGSGKSSELMGYRYDSGDKAVETRSSDRLCNEGSWVNLTDEKTVEVTAFTIADLSPPPIDTGGAIVTVREFHLTISGRLKRNPAITLTLEDRVRVRNEGVN
jgi:type II secretory pathway pseudopilin PulG